MNKSSSFLLKATAVFLSLIFFLLMLVSAALVLVCLRFDFYSKSKEELIETNLRTRLEEMSDELVLTIDSFGFDGAEKYYKFSNFFFEVYGYGGGLIYSTRDGREHLIVHEIYSYTNPEIEIIDGEYYAHHLPEKLESISNTLDKMGVEYIACFISSQFSEVDEFSNVYKFIDTAHDLRYYFVAGIPVFFLLTALLFVYLMAVSGHRPNREEIILSPIDKIPFDIYLFPHIVYLYFAQKLFFSLWRGSEYIIAACLLPLTYLVLLLFSMSFFARVKKGDFFKSFLSLRVGRAVILTVCRFSLWLVRTLWLLISSIPVFWKCSFLFLGIFAAVLLCYGIFSSSAALVLSILIFFSLFCAGIKFLYDYKRVRDGIERIAKGDFFHKINTDKMSSFSSKTAESVNSIQSNVQNIVEMGLKSERFKTELITNVSHDLKTPLTSIVNYVDLIKKEECDNEKVREWVDVLDRQAQRLKKLCEDLVEASKASTGNIEIEYAPCELGELLVQTFGEYKTRLEASGLTLFTSLPDAPVVILADGRRLWRIFDNIMNNVTKYALRETRVWVTLEVRDGRARAAFKNISKEPLKLSGEELTERFVRADTSRNSEGSGLGLSIAKSLTELQGGTLSVTVDGDLFKVEVEFALYAEK